MKKINLLPLLSPALFRVIIFGLCLVGCDFSITETVSTNLAQYTITRFLSFIPSLCAPDAGLCSMSYLIVV